MVGDVYDYDNLKIYIISGELRKIIFFKDSDEYQQMLEKGMRIGKSVIFDNETDKIEKFFWD